MEREQSNFAPSRRGLDALLVAGAAVALPTLPAIASVVEPDAALIALGRELQAAWGAERAGWARVDIEGTDAACDAADELFASTGDVVDRIVTLPATTLAGFRVKAQALAWTHGGDEITAQEIADKPEGTSVSTDTRLIADIIRELRALG